MNKYNIGDRVVTSNTFGWSHGIILDHWIVSTPFYHVGYYNKDRMVGTNRLKEDLISLDVQYYRELRLNKILNNN